MVKKINIFQNLKNYFNNENEIKKINIFQYLKNYFNNKKEKKKRNNDLYFIEGAADVDLIGYDSYVQSLNDAIEHDAKFIGLISDYGNGKSTLLNMLKNSKKGKKYDLVSINLWNCDEEVDDDTIDIHRIFLHQLVDKIGIKSKNYYKKKIDKNYSLFDIKLNKKCWFYFFFLSVFMILAFFEKIGFNTFFPEDISTCCYFFLAVLFVLNIVIYKPVVSYKKADTSRREIDENDTKDLYYEILDAYSRRIRKKTLVICLEELDRYNKTDKVVEYLKEFYKFYIGSHKKVKVVFIVSIKSAVQISSLGDAIEIGEGVDNEGKLTTITKIKSIYEKLFDYILNLRPVNIHDYDVIVFELLKTKKISIEANGITFPLSNDLKEWKYLYKGENVKIRDIKHRYNFAISLYLSLKETSITPNINKCLFMAYLEDEYSYLYNFLTVKKDLLNNILIKYASKYEISKVTISELSPLSDNEIKVLNEGLTAKYISIDYNYYFYKFPLNKEPFSLYEQVLYNAIFFDEDNENLNMSIEKLTKTKLLEIIDRRAIPNILPDIIFKYPKLYALVIDEHLEILENTIKVNYNIVNNYEKAKEFLFNTKNISRHNFNIVLSKYNEIVMPSIMKLSIEERTRIRLNLVKILGKDIVLFSNLFLDDNQLISEEEIVEINDLNKIVSLINYDKFDDSLFMPLENKINTAEVSNKNSIINLLEEISCSKHTNSIKYKDFFYKLNLKAYRFSHGQYVRIFRVVREKLELDNPVEFNRFINHLNYYCLNYDKHYLSIIENGDITLNVKNYVNVLNKFKLINDTSMSFLSNYGKEHAVFGFCEEIRNEFYRNKYYNYYVISTRIDKKEFDIEEDKIDILSSYYIKEFENRKNWKTPISHAMKKFLYDNVEYSKLDSSRLIIFTDELQTKELISAVLNTADEKFINKYLSKISKIKTSDEEMVYKLIGDYKNSNKIKRRSGIIKLKQLTNNSKYLEYLDGRKKKELVNS